MTILKCLLLVFLLAPSLAEACSFENPPEFEELLERADKVFIARLLDQRVTDRFAHRRPVIEGRIEIIETVLGDSPAFQRIEFYNGPCGGVRLDVGHHYVVFSSQAGETIKLALAENALISIEGEYIPGFDEQNYRYPFLRLNRPGNPGGLLV